MFKPFHKYSFQVLALVLLALLMPFSGKADCYRQLTDNFSRDAVHYTLPETSVDVNIERMSVEFAQQAVIRLIRQLKCFRGAKMFEARHVSNTACRRIHPAAHTSRTCYVESEFGHFLVSVDVQELIHIQFFRWD